MRSVAATIDAEAEERAFPLAATAELLRPSVLRGILELSARRDVISFGVGVPGTDLLPRQLVAALAAEVLHAGALPLQYGMPSALLKEQIVALMAARGVACRPEQVFLTNGAQQAMDLLTRLLLDPGGELLLEETIYDGIQLAVRPLRPKIRTLPSEPGTGLDPLAVEEALHRGARPAFLYLIPEGHNPMGSSLPLRAREHMVELARTHHFPILEDDTYGFLQYGPRPRPAMASLDGEQVIYLGSASKILAPGLRMGWIVAPEALIPALSTLKHGTDIDSTTFGHALVAAFLARGALTDHLALLRTAYHARRDAMLAALAERLGSAARWTVPESGFFVWAELREGLDSLELLRHAVASEGVAFSPGHAFATAGGDRAFRGLRLSFASVPEDAIGEGIARLGRAIASVRSEPVEVAQERPRP